MCIIYLSILISILNTVVLSNINIEHIFRYRCRYSFYITTKNDQIRMHDLKKNYHIHISVLNSDVKFLTTQIPTVEHIIRIVYYKLL